MNIGGFELTVEGIELTGASSDLANVTFNPENGGVIGFDFSGFELPAGEGTLVHLEFSGISGGSEISVSDVIIAEGGNLQMTSYGPENTEQ